MALVSRSARGASDGIAAALDRPNPPWDAPSPESESETRDRILSLVRIATSNQSTISLDELHLLLPYNTFLERSALERYLRTDRVLSRTLLVLGGEVTLASSPGLAARRGEQRELTSSRIQVAETFVSQLSVACPWVEVAGISGSTAFGGAKPQDDVDFFLVTRKDRVWITLLIAMTRARLLRMQVPGTPVFCFNRAMEREACVQSFRDARDPLFAREALSLRVVHGQAFYQDLLRASSWMRDPFPGLYDRRTSVPSARRLGEDSHSGAHWSVANAVAFLTLGPYLWLIGLVRNARLKRQGRRDAVFRTIVERSFCAYESQKYEELGETYRRTF